MIRKGTHKPTVEDAIEISGIEILHPGGFELTKRTAELCQLKAGMSVLDVSSGRGTQAIYYADSFGATVTGIDISPTMIETASAMAENRGLSGKLRFVLGDSQQLPFEDGSFDVVINECAVGIPDDSQQVLDEMVRVLKPGGAMAIHESTWRKSLPDEKDELSERYGTTPLEFDEWLSMLQKAGVTGIISEIDQWSQPDMFWKIRKDRDVRSYRHVMSPSEKVLTAFRIFKEYGIGGVIKVFENEKILFRAILDGKLGYALYKGIKAV